MNVRLLRDSIEELQLLRLELHGRVEDSVIEMLEKAILDLQALENSPDAISGHEILYIVGSILEKLPAIVELIYLLTNLKK